MWEASATPNCGLGGALTLHLCTLIIIIMRHRENVLWWKIMRRCENVLWWKRRRACHGGMTLREKERGEWPDTSFMGPKVSWNVLWRKGFNGWRSNASKSQQVSRWICIYVLKMHVCDDILSIIFYIFTHYLEIYAQKSELINCIRSNIVKMHFFFFLAFSPFFEAVISSFV